MSGKVFDLTGSYHAAFVNGIAWNLLNLAIVPCSCCWRLRRHARAAAGLSALRAARRDRSTRVEPGLEALADGRLRIGVEALAAVAPAAAAVSSVTCQARAPAVWVAKMRLELRCASTLAVDQHALLAVEPGRARVEVVAADEQRSGCRSTSALVCRLAPEEPNRLDSTLRCRPAASAPTAARRRRAAACGSANSRRAPRRHRWRRANWSARARACRTRRSHARHRWPLRRARSRAR